MSTGLNRRMKDGLSAPDEKAVLPGGLDSVRAPVVVAKPKKKRKRPVEHDPHQVKRAPKPKFKKTECWGHNDRVWLTGMDINTTMSAEDFAAFVGSLVETADERDRAHKCRRLIEEGMPRHLGESFVLLSHDELDHLIRKSSKKPKVTRRRYHPSQLTSRGVAFDSMYDNAFRIAQEMHNEGVNLGWGVRRIGSPSGAEHDRAQVLAGMSRDEARALLNGKITETMTERERSLEYQATRLIHDAENRGLENKNP